MQDYRKIEAWKRAVLLGNAIWGCTKNWSRAGAGSLRTQLTRAADSIAANVVEGSGADSNREFARFLGMSIKSANETEHHLSVARDRGLLSPSTWTAMSRETEEIRKMIYAYREKVKANPN